MGSRVTSIRVPSFGDRARRLTSEVRSHEGRAGSSRCQVYLFAGAVTLAGCTHYGVNSFSVTPRLTCARKPVEVKWDVSGHASLHAEPAPPGWVDETASTGTKTTSVATATEFTLTALDANPAKGNSRGSQTVQVTPQDDNRAGSAPCDVGTRKCSGTFTLASGNSVTVSRLSNPTFVRLGKVVDRTVCVTPPSAARVCIPSGGSAEVHFTADGDWTIEAELATDEPVTPPPQLRVHFDFGCP